MLNKEKDLVKNQENEKSSTENIVCENNSSDANIEENQTFIDETISSENKETSENGDSEVTFEQTVSDQETAKTSETSEEEQERLMNEFKEQGFEFDEDGEPIAKKEKPKKGVTIFLIVALIVLAVLIIVVVVLNIASSSSDSCSDSGGCTGINYDLSIIRNLFQ